MKRRTVVALAAGAVLVGAVVYALSRRGRDTEVRYETVAVDRGPVVSRVTATGTAAALVTVQVGSQVSGRISDILVDFNSKVQKGQILARIDPQILSAELERARANFTAAEGNLTKARAEAVDAERKRERAEALAESDLVAQADLDSARAAADAARAQVVAVQGSVAQARAALRQAEVNLTYTTIRSPIHGIVISRDVNVGQTVAASLQAPTLFQIAEDLRKMELHTSVAEADVGKLSPGAPAAFTVDAYPREQFRGTVRQIRNAPQTLQNVVTYDAVIDVDNAELKLRPGMTANVTFVHDERADALRIPNAALRFRPPAELLARSENGARGDQAGGDQGAGGRRGRRSGGGASAAVRADGQNAGGARQGGASSAGAARPGAGPGGGAAADGAAAGGPPPDRRTVWVLRDDTPAPVEIRIGVSDGTRTEVVEGSLRPGDRVITEAVGGPQPRSTPPGGGFRRIF